MYVSKKFVLLIFVYVKYGVHMSFGSETM